MPAELSSIHDTISQCDATSGMNLARSSGSGILMSRGFVAAVEEAFGDQARFEHAVVYDEGKAVACGSLCAFPVDINMLADGSARRITEILSKHVPSMMRKKVIFCGLPVSVGTKQLAIAPGARHEDALRSSMRSPCRWHDVSARPTSFSRSFRPRIARGWTSCKSSGTGASRRPR